MDRLGIDGVGFALMNAPKDIVAALREALTSSFDLGVEVEAILLEGDPVAGTIVRHDEDSLTLQVGAREKTIRLARLADLVVDVRTCAAALLDDRLVVAV